MTDTGIIRRIDELGRITLPSELRKHLHIAIKDPVQVYVEGDKIILKKAVYSDIFTGETENLIEFHGKLISKESVRKMAIKAGLIEN